MSRLLPLLALVGAAFCLGACDDDDDDDRFVPTPRVTPTPTPGDDAGIFPSPTPSLGNPATSSGATMTSAVEQIRVVALDTGNAGNAGDSTIQIARSNGEIWEFGLAVIPNVQVGAAVSFQASSLIFGDPSGDLVLADGTSYQITGSARIR